jgi:molybdopterin converting factor small subunit
MESAEAQVRVSIPPALRQLCGGEPELALAADSVAGLLAELARRHPQVHVCVCDERGEPRPHINVFVNNDHVRARAGLMTKLTTGDLVTILPAVSGG